MGRSQETFGKKERNKKQEKKKKDKAEKKLARKDVESKGSFEDMLAYVDYEGNIVDTPPDPTKREEIKAEDIVIGIPKKEDMEDVDFTRTGMVTFFNGEKGYGFIKDKDSSESIFVHINNCSDEIKEGNLVNFETEKGPKGLTAVKVKISK
jgi:cold shock CspA family protein